MYSPNYPFFVQISDLHIRADLDFRFSDSASPWENLQQTVQHLSQLKSKPDFLVVTGDLADIQEQAVYAPIANLLTALPFPVYWLGGNHDDPDYMEAQAEKLGVQPEKTFAIKQTRFVLLNSVEPSRKESYGILSEKELDFLRVTLASTNEAQCIICLHHPPVPTGSAWMDKMCLLNAEALLNIIYQYEKVKAVLFGHIHSELDININSIRFLATPATSRQFKIAEEFAFDALPLGYREIGFDTNDQLQTEVVRLNMP